MPSTASELANAEASASEASPRAALDDPKRSFLRLASHELRTPLNSILGFSEILASELYGPLGAPQYKEYAEIIQGSGRKLLKLVIQVMGSPGLRVLRLGSTSAPNPWRRSPRKPWPASRMSSLAALCTSA